MLLSAAREDRGCCRRSASVHVVSLALFQLVLICGPENRSHRASVFLGIVLPRTPLKRQGWSSNCVTR
jgi:hypothetical protein